VIRVNIRARGDRATAVSGVPVIITGSRGMMLHARDLAGIISIFRAMPRSAKESLTYLMKGTRSSVLSLPDFTCNHF